MEWVNGDGMGLRLDAFGMVSLDWVCIHKLGPKDKDFDKMGLDL